MAKPIRRIHHSRGVGRSRGPTQAAPVTCGLIRRAHRSCAAARARQRVGAPPAPARRTSLGVWARRKKLVPTGAPGQVCARHLGPGLREPWPRPAAPGASWPAPANGRRPPAQPAPTYVATGRRLTRNISRPRPLESGGPAPPLRMRARVSHRRVCHVMCARRAAYLASAGLTWPAPGAGQLGATCGPATCAPIVIQMSARLAARPPPCQPYRRAPALAAARFPQSHAAGTQITDLCHVCLRALRNPCRRFLVRAGGRTRTGPLISA